MAKKKTIWKMPETRPDEDKQFVWVVRDESTTIIGQSAIRVWSDWGSYLETINWWCYLDEFNATLPEKK